MKSLLVIDNPVIAAKLAGHSKPKTTSMTIAA
jgi:hypothetical protein